MPDWWNDEARRAAARQWGRRYWRWYAVAHFAWQAVLAVAAVAVVAAAGYGAGRVARHIGWPTLLQLVAAAIGAALLAWLAIDAATGARTRRRLAGYRSPIPALAFTAVAVLVAESLLIR